ncbi:MAG: SRPBCC family protein [Candidatus Obscuribacterales bacterium]|nr:SRPBCC family protein [Candidatus Obscuribacterales bacterium]
MANRTSLLKLSDLWRWEGTIDRLPYIIWGSGLVGVKLGIDTFISGVFFHRAWSWLNYVSPGQAVDILALNGADQQFYAYMLLFSLPFIWVGIILTIRRLRGAGLPVWLCKLFFLPVINLIVFSTLCILPTQSDKNIFDKDDDLIETDSAAKPQIANPETGANAKSKSVPALPGSEASPALTSGSKGNALAGATNELISSPYEGLSDAFYAIVMTVPAAAILGFIGIAFLKAYGWGLFVGLPFGVGMASAYFYGRNRLRSLTQCLGIAFAALTLLGAAVFFFAWEGMICLLMAAPIVYGLAFMGALLGHSMQKKKNLPEHHTRAAIIALLFILPLSMGADYADQTEFPSCLVRTSCDIAAPPETVWKYIIAFPKLPEPKEWIFHTGVAYPIGATIDGEGAGAVRHCNFSTGTFVEPITVWQPPSLLQFGVLSQPEPMKEMSIVHNIQPAHLNGYLNVHKGEFRLSPIENADGTRGTRIVGTTWYQNRMWPASYWRLYADGIMHSIHTRVLTHIKSISEADIANSSPTLGSGAPRQRNGAPERGHCATGEANGAGRLN